MAGGSPSPTTRTSEQTCLTMQLTNAAQQSNPAKQRVVSSRTGINLMQAQYYNLQSPKMSAGRQSNGECSIPASSNIYGPSTGSDRVAPINGPALASHTHSPFQHARTALSHSPYQSLEPPAAAYPADQALPLLPYENDNTTTPSAGQILRRTQGMARAQPLHSSYSDPFVGPEISSAMGPYFKTPSSRNYLTTSLPHQTGGTIYPSLSPSPIQGITHLQQERSNDRSIDYSGSYRGTDSAQVPLADTVVSNPGAGHSRVDVNSVAQIADLLKKGDYSRRPRRTARGQKASEDNRSDTPTS
jgi:hypothetical protein